MTKALEIKSIPISKAKVAPYNPRVDLKPGDPEYDQIKKSIVEFGVVEPLVWNRHNGVLIGGHQRLKVMRELGFKMILVSCVDIADKKKEKALNVALNKIGGQWDDQKLADILTELKGSDLGLEATGFSEHDLDSLLEDLKGPGEFPKLPPQIEVTHICPKCGFGF